MIKNKTIYIKYISLVSESILKQITANSYYDLNDDEKNNMQTNVYKNLKNLTSSKIDLTNPQVGKKFLNDMIITNSDLANYGLCGVLKDILKNENNFTEKQESSKKVIKIKKK